MRKIPYLIHLRVQGRSKFHEDIIEMKKDLDAYLEKYNRNRPHQGRAMNGKTPLKAFLDGRPKDTPKTQLGNSAA